MPTNVHMEALSPTMEEGQLVKWLKKEGDAVSEGDVLAEIETDKATMELVARGSGVLRNVKLEEGATAPVGEVIATIAGEGEDVPEAEAGGGAAEKAGAKSSKDGAGAATADAGEKAEASVEAGAADEAEEAEASDDDEEASEETGEAAERAVAPPAAKGAAAGSKPSAPRAQAPTNERAEAEPRGAPADRPDGRVKASPLARKLASEAGLALTEVRGSGPGGRITKADIEAAMKRPAGAPSAAAPSSRPAAGAEGGDVTQVPVTQMRKAIAKRLVTSIGPIPTFYLTIDVDVGRLSEARGRLNEILEKDGAKASVNDFVIKAVAMALARHPEVNAQWGDSVILRHNRIHVGVAVAIEDGLITPIIRDADRKGIGEIAREVRELAGRAREKKLKPEEYTGATFSVSNLGMFGIHEFTAIINPPESAILAVGAAEDAVVVVDGQPAVRQRMRMTMSCDHRVIDGATGARFLQTLRAMIEEPVMMLA